MEVFEMNPYPGGRCGQIIREGHRFDTGATILMMPSIYRKVFRALDLNFDEVFKLTKLDDVYRLYFPDNTSLTFSVDHDKMKPELEQIEPGSYSRAEKYIKNGYEFFTLAMRDLLGRNFYSIREFITLRNVLLLIRLKAYLKHRRYVRRFFRHPYLQQAFTFQNIYVGQSPLESSALFAMLPSAELTEGALFPEGGMYSITSKLMSLAKESGVIFHFSKEAARILTQGELVSTIEFKDGTSSKADLIIANADLPYVYNELLPDKQYRRIMEKKQYSCSALVFHWGLGKFYPDLSHHSVFLSEDLKHNMNMIFNHNTIPENPSFYIHAPVRTDPGAAPEDCDTISVIIPTGHLDSRKVQDWQKSAHTARESVLKRLAGAGMGDLRENIKFEICCTPGTWEELFHVSKGSVFGSLKHSIMQMGYFRPHNRHNKYKNLYFAGGSTHPGNGVPLVLLSALLVSERIIKEN